MQTNRGDLDSSVILRSISNITYKHKHSIKIQGLTYVYAALEHSLINKVITNESKFNPNFFVSFFSSSQD